MRFKSHIMSGLLFSIVLGSAAEVSGKKISSDHFMQLQQSRNTQYNNDTLGTRFNKATDDDLLNSVFKTAQQQYRNMLVNSKDLKKYPRTSDANGYTKYVPISDWTGGFWPGN